MSSTVDPAQIEAMTSTCTVEENASQSAQPELILRLTAPAHDPENANRVQWAADTVDNEFLGKKKSKCCCIYKKPKRWNDDSDSDHSDSDCETGHCRGHVEKRAQPNQSEPSSSSQS